MTACSTSELDAVNNNDYNGEKSRTETSSTITRELTGTVAVGAPVAGKVTIVDANGNTDSTQSDASGNFTINLAGRPGPYLIRSEPDNGALPAVYSYATGAGVANITPFTQLALFLAYHADLNSAFDTWTTLAASWNRDKLEQAMATINANFAVDLQNAGVDPKFYDFFTQPFNADHTGIDAFLDNYAVSLNDAAKGYKISDSSGQPVTFDESVDTTDYYIGARFVPDNTGTWTYTWTSVVDGKEKTSDPVTVQSYFVPWSQERNNELFWNSLANNPKTVSYCEQDADVSCKITIEITQMESTYDVVGNGEVGTVVTASAAYAWKVSGWYQYKNIPIRQNIDESHSWSYAWRWERTL